MAADMSCSGHDSVGLHCVVQLTSWRVVGYVSYSFPKGRTEFKRRTSDMLKLLPKHFPFCLITPSISCVWGLDLSAHWEWGFGRKRTIPTQRGSSDHERTTPHLVEIGVNVKDLNGQCQYLHWALVQAVPISVFPVMHRLADADVLCFQRKDIFM